MDINKAYLYQKGGNNNTSIIRTRLHERISLHNLDYPTQGNNRKAWNMMLRGGPMIVKHLIKRLMLTRSNAAFKSKHDMRARLQENNYINYSSIILAMAFIACYW